MYYLVLLSLILSVRSYMSKLLINDLTSYEYLFLYSIVLLLVSGTILWYKKISYKHLTCVSWLQCVIIFVSVLITLYSATMSFNMLHNNNVVKGKFLIRGMSLVFLSMIGYFFFEEEITYKKMLGLGFIVGGIFLTSN